MQLIIRGIAWMHRLFSCLDQLGWINTFKLFFYGRVMNREVKLKLPNQTDFHCHGRLDMVSSHFYSLGYFIESNNRKEISTIIDAGANIGVETARFHVHHPQAEIIAIEAAQRNFEVLQKNFGNNEKVTPVFGGLWPVETALSVISTSADMQAFEVVEGAETADSIAAFTIPNLLKKKGWTHIDILKMDIEGAEYELFSRHYKSWIDKVNVFIFEVPDADRPGATQMIFKTLEPFSFHTYHCGENLVLIKADLPWRLKKIVGFEKKRS